MSSIFKRGKYKNTPTTSISHSAPVGAAHPSGSDTKYQEYRDSLIKATKVVKGAADVTSFLGPVKATCQLAILFLETIKVGLYPGYTTSTISLMSYNRQ
jgi:hypothetical protein